MRPSAAGTCAAQRDPRSFRFPKGIRCRAAPEKPDRSRVRRAFANLRGRWPRTGRYGWQALRPRRSYRSSRARGAARELLNLILGHESLAELEVIGRRGVVDAEDSLTRPKVALGIPVAIQAPFHLQRLLLPHERHAIDLAMTRRAADPLVDVDAVVEVDEIRQIVHARPLDRFAGAEALAYGLQKRAVGKNLRVAVHARLRRRNARERGILDRRVTVAAVEAVARDVAFVAELDRLLARDARLRHPGRTRDFGRQPEEARHEEDSAEDADPSNRVGAAVKDL